jgi:hypothetical protein
LFSASFPNSVSGNFVNTFVLSLWYIVILSKKTWIKMFPLSSFAPQAPWIQWLLSALNSTSERLNQAHTHTHTIK